MAKKPETDSVRKAVRDTLLVISPASFTEICKRLSIDPRGKSDNKFRDVDRALQHLRKHGEATYDSGKWNWVAKQ